MLEKMMLEWPGILTMVSLKFTLFSDNLEVLDFGELKDIA